MFGDQFQDLNFHGLCFEDYLSSPAFADVPLLVDVCQRNLVHCSRVQPDRFERDVTTHKRRRLAVKQNAVFDQDSLDEHALACQENIALMGNEVLALFECSARACSHDCRAWIGPIIE